VRDIPFKLIAFVLINEIHEEISESSFFSWQVDETTDISAYSQWI
jgi:hypothetical protein